MTSNHTTIPVEVPYPSHYCDVGGVKMHYIEQGRGYPILFLHGVPASSYVWRNVIPHLSILGRCIAPDLIGMGKSDKPNIDYTVFEHIAYLEKFIDELNLKHVTLVMHGWGSVIGLDYAMRHPDNCRGLVFYEGYLRPFNEADVSLPYQEHLTPLKKQGTDIIENGADYVTKMLLQSMMRPLTREELLHYREPFLAKATGKPLYQCLQEIPTLQGKSKVDQLIAANSKKLAQSQIPKLLLYSVPGFVTTISTVMWAKENLPLLEIADIGEELHFAQESNPALMGETISVWLQGVEQGGTSSI